MYSTQQSDIAAMREGHSLAKRLLDARQEPDDAQVATIAAALDAAQRVEQRRKDADEDADLRRSLAPALRDDQQPLGRSSTWPNKAVGRWSAKTATKAIAGQFRPGQKAIAPSATAVAPAGLTERQPVELGRPATSLLNAVPVQALENPPVFSHLRQTQRTNAAAVVPTGGQKPTSVYGVERISGELAVVAHLSEPVDRFWLEDLAELETWLGAELEYGLDTAVERALLNGAGANTGMLNTSGIQTQPFSVDPYETLRRAITKLQVVGGTGQITFAVHPSDWEAMHLLRETTTGAFLATSAQAAAGPQGGVASPPVGEPLLAAWGVGLVLSLALTPGIAVAFDASAVGMYTDGQARLEWNSASRFGTNELVARMETRVAPVIRRPMSVVSVDMLAAP